jgi:hypothetical protein
MSQESALFACRSIGCHGFTFRYREMTCLQAGPGRCPWTTAPPQLPGEALVESSNLVGSVAKLNEIAIFSEKS